MKYLLIPPETLAASGIGQEPWRRRFDGKVLVSEAEARDVFGDQWDSVASPLSINDVRTLQS